MTEFEGVAPALAHALAARGYDAPTPVQRAVLDPALAGADLLVSARTGSGKTVAFGLAVANTLLGEDGALGEAAAPLLLAVAPTRELALQVRRELDWLYAKAGAVIASCVGGMDPRAERRALERGAHVVVGTPGRLRDHIERHALDTGSLRAVVLDEADEMLDLGFREDLEFILDATPPERRTLMFSATVPAPIERLARRYQRDAERVSTVEAGEQHADIEYRALVTAPREGENAVLNVLRYYEADNALVFCNTRAAVARLTARLANRGFQVVALSGELSQAERTHALQALRDGRARVCVATDVAARGIDLPRLDLVVHAELPSNPETLLHRSGRTGRAGRKGVSAMIVEPRARAKAERLLRFGKLEATWDTPPTADEVSARDEARMMADPAFTEPPAEDEAEFAARLVERFEPTAIATAYLRLARAGRSAPEDIARVPVEGPRGGKGEGPRERSARRGFDASRWVSLSVGRRQNAEPRWLLPLLINHADIDKGGIGAIRMRADETFVEIDAARADAFLASLGPDKMLETVRVRPLAGVPDFGAPSERDEGPGRDAKAFKPKEKRKDGWQANKKPKHGKFKDKRPKGPRGPDADGAPRPALKRGAKRAAPARRAPSGGS